MPSKCTQLNSTADFGTCSWYLRRTDSIKKEVTDAANHSLILREAFLFFYFFSKWPELLDDEQQCHKKKAGMTTSNLASSQGEAVGSSS